MSFRLINNLVLKLSQTTDLCLWLQLYSALVWTKIGFFRTADRLRITETTLTQNLVFDFYMLAANSEYPIELYQSKDEKANGNDLEIWVETAHGFVSMPCQAKIIQKEHRYPTISHKVGETAQINLLLDYAQKKRGLGIYLLYNFCDSQYVCEKIERKSGISIEHFGCSLSKASYLKSTYCDKKYRKGRLAWNIPTFNDLHLNHALPFHSIVCPGNGFENWLLPSNDQKDQFKFYSRQEIKDATGWEHLAPPPRIGYIHTYDNKKFITKSSNEMTPSEFSPKFRIVFAKEKRSTTISHWS